MCVLLPAVLLYIVGGWEGGRERVGRWVWVGEGMGHGCGRMGVGRYVEYRPNCFTSWVGGRVSGMVGVGGWAMGVNGWVLVGTKNTGPAGIAVVVPLLKFTPILLRENN